MSDPQKSDIPTARPDRRRNPEQRLVLQEAFQDDSNNLSEFFTSIPVRGEMDIKIQRQKSFFSFYQRMGVHYRTFIIKDGNETLGIASFLFKRLAFQNRVIKIAHACDLRISPNRKAILTWSKFFEPLLEKIRREENCHTFVTSINHSETQALNAFIRPKLKRAHQPQYALARSYNVISIHGFYPFRNPPNKNITVRPFEDEDKPKLVEYLKKNCQQIDFMPAEMVENVVEYIDQSNLYSWGQFMIAFDADQNVVGCVHPLSSGLLQDYMPQTYNSRAHNFRQFLKVASWLGFARRLTRPFSRTQRQESLHFRLLHFLFSNHQEVFNALIRACYATSSQNEFVTYAFEATNFKMKPPRGSIFAELPYGLYSIETNNREIPPELSLLQTSPIWLDFLWF